MDRIVRTSISTVAWQHTSESEIRGSDGLHREDAPHTGIAPSRANAARVGEHCHGLLPHGLP